MSADLVVSGPDFARRRTEIPVRSRIYYLENDPPRWVDLARISADYFRLFHEEHPGAVLRALALWRQAILEEVMPKSALDHIFSTVRGLWTPDDRHAYGAWRRPDSELLARVLPP